MIRSFCEGAFSFAYFAGFHCDFAWLQMLFDIEAERHAYPRW